MTQIKKRIAVCENEPVTVEGLKQLLEATDDLEFLEVVGSLALVPALIERSSPDLLLIDKAVGPCSVLDWLRASKPLPNMPFIVIWGASITEADAFRFLLAGARGVIQKTATVDLMMACLRTVSTGRSWTEDSVHCNFLHAHPAGLSALTVREQQVFVLVRKQLRIKAIATQLGICAGTVKIHLKNIYTKTGVHNLNGLEAWGLTVMSRP